MKLSAFISKLQKMEEINPDAKVMVSALFLNDSEIMTAKAVMYSNNGKQSCNRLMFNRNDFDTVLIGMRSDSRAVRNITNEIEQSTRQYIAAVMCDIPYENRIDYLANFLSTSYIGTTDPIYYFDHKNFFVGRELKYKFPKLLDQKCSGWEFMFNNHDKTDRLQISNVTYENFVEAFGNVTDVVGDALFKQRSFGAFGSFGSGGSSTLTKTPLPLPQPRQETEYYMNDITSTSVPKEILNLIDGVSNFGDSVNIENSEHIPETELQEPRELQELQKLQEIQELQKPLEIQESERKAPQKYNKFTKSTIVDRGPGFLKIKK